MPLLYIRAIESYQPGTNASDVIINQVHFNLPTLDHYNYTLYTNGTLSNGSNCYLTFNNFRPYMFPTNGSFVNGTSCYSPIHPVGRHAAVGMGFALAFVLSIICTLANLRKHGRRFLPRDGSRIGPVGRRWKWYWVGALGVCGTVGSFMGVDVDRDHVQGAPLVIQSVFFTLLIPVMLAAVWEGVRHWASWQERQIQNRDPFAFSMEHSTREQQEQLLPLIFYLFTAITFFLTVPRDWGTIELQRSKQQQASRAEPFATDTRFKAAGFIALCAVAVICYSLEHSIYRYIPRPASTRRRRCKAMFYMTEVPSQFLVAIALLLVKIGYGIASAFNFSISPLRYGVHPGWIFGLGFGPALLLILLFNISGFCEMNEDKTLIYQSTHLETALASDTGVGRKSWGVAWLGRLPGRRRRERQQRDQERGFEDEYDDNPVEMQTITMTPPRAGEKKAVDDEDDDEDPFKDPVQVTTAITATGSGGSSSTPNTNTDTQSSEAGYPFLGDGRRSDDSIQFVREVLSSLDGGGDGNGTEQGHGNGHGHGHGSSALRVVGND